MEAARSSSNLPDAFSSETQANLNIKILPNGLPIHNWRCGETTYIVNSSSTQFTIMLDFMGQLDTEFTRYEGALCYQNSIIPVTSAPGQKEAIKSKATKAQAAVPEEIKQWKFNFELDAGELSKRNLMECLTTLEKKLNKKNWDSLLIYILNPQQHPSAKDVIAILGDCFNLNLPISLNLTSKKDNELWHFVRHDYYDNKNRGIRCPRSYLLKIFNTSYLYSKECQRHKLTGDKRLIRYKKESHATSEAPIICRQHPNYEKVCDQSLWDFTGTVIEFFIKCVPDEIEIIQFIFNHLPATLQFKALSYIVRTTSFDCPLILEKLLKKQGDTEQVSHQMQVDVNQITEQEQESNEGSRLLLSAIELERFEYALLILKNTKVDLTFTNEQGDTALHIMMAFHTKRDSKSKKLARECLDELLSKIKEPALLWQKNNNSHSPIWHYCQSDSLYFEHGVKLLKKLDETTSSPLSQTQSEDLFEYTAIMIQTFGPDEIRMLFEFPIIQELPLVHPIKHTIVLESQTNKTLMETNGIPMKDIMPAQTIETEIVCLTLVLAQNKKWDNYFTLYGLIAEGKANINEAFFEFLLDPKTPNESKALEKIEDDYNYAFKLNEHKQLLAEFIESHPEMLKLINKKKSELRLKLTNNMHEATADGYVYL